MSARLAMALLVVAALMAVSVVPQYRPASAKDDDVRSSPHDDADRNRIFDDLDATMASQPDDWTRNVIVVLNVQPTPEEIQSLHQAIGNFSIHSNKANATDAEGKPWTLIPAFSANLTKHQIGLLSQLSDVQQVEDDEEPIHLMTLDTDKVATGIQAVRDDPRFNLTGDADHNDGTGEGNHHYDYRSDIVACILDTGIHNTHQDLDEGQVVLWQDELLHTQNPDDEPAVPHGTLVAGVLAGQGDGDSLYTGVAPGTALVVVKVDETPADGGVNASALNITPVIDGMEFCSNSTIMPTYHIRIMSMSLGAGPNDFCQDQYPALSQAATAAWNKGLIVVAAAGNGGPATCKILSPGAAPEIITVGAASDPGNEACLPPGDFVAHGWFIWGNSSRGPTTTGVIKPDILAPGVCVTTTNYGFVNNTLCVAVVGAYCTTSGTSLATPFIAGVVSLMLQANPNLTPNQTKAILLQTAEHWGPDMTGGVQPQNYDMGAGRVQAYEAIKAAANVTTGTGPLNPTHVFRTDTMVGGQTDVRIINLTNTSAHIAVTIIVPTQSEGPPDQFQNLAAQITLQARGVTGCASAEADTLASRQGLVSYDAAACGSLPYWLNVTDLSGMGKYWLDLSAYLSDLPP